MTNTSIHLYYLRATPTLVHLGFDGIDYLSYIFSRLDNAFNASIVYISSCVLSKSFNTSVSGDESLSVTIYSHVPSPTLLKSVVLVVDDYPLSYIVSSGISSVSDVVSVLNIAATFNL